jgi:hypothetical protein
MLHDLKFIYISTKRTTTGGTIKVKIKSREDKWLKCNKCDEFFINHYYIHQCDKYHIYCNSCLVDKKKCKNCLCSFVEKLKIKR